jgi:hypothetical protein
MTTSMGGVWPAIAEDVRLYPSPHNSQPIKLRALNDATAEVYYDLDLGLPAESFGIPFAHVCAGVFLHALAVVAGSHGYRTIEALDHSDLDFGSAERLHFLGTVTLERKPADAEARAAHADFLVRRTSRRPYDNTLVDAVTIEGAAEIARSAGFRFRTTNDATVVRDLVHINQATLFDDLRNDAVYGEIMRWLRFSKSEAAEKKDGLSAETMLMPGPILRFAMKHRGLWQLPIVGPVIRGVYLRTMRGVRQLGWLEGPFSGPADYIEAGRAFLRLWLHFTRAGVYLHPFGTVITNPSSHDMFVRALDITEGDGEMAWMLFRFGHSKTPPFAHRRPAERMLLPTQEVAS